MARHACALIAVALLVAAAAQVEASSAGAELQMVAVLTRHGDRTPLYALPAKVDKNTWKEAPGQLTALGMKQLHELGTKLRKRYCEGAKPLLSQSYVASEIYARSTDVDRTLMSAQSLLSGLYPPGTGPETGLPHRWQPIPVHTHNFREDTLLANAASCDRYWALRLGSFEKEPFLSFAQTHASVIHEMSRVLEVNATLQNWDHIYDPLFIEAAHGLPLPHGVTPFLFNQTVAILDWLYARHYSNLVMGRLAAGPLLNEIVRNMETRVSGGVGPKFYLYSAHDTTILAMLGAIGEGVTSVPPYASHVIFELYSDATVRLLYNDKPHFSSCGPESVHQRCPFETFRRLVDPGMLVDVEGECSVDQMSLGLLILFLVLGAIALVSAMYWMKTWFRAPAASKPMPATRAKPKK